LPREFRFRTHHPSISSPATTGISATLPWGTRIKVAIGAAKGLAFLHAASTSVIYRDFKASNILLDSVGVLPSPIGSCCTIIFVLLFFFLISSLNSEPNRERLLAEIRFIIR